MVMKKFLKKQIFFYQHLPTNKISKLNSNINIRNSVSHLETEEEKIICLFLLSKPKCFFFTRTLLKKIQ